MVLQNNVVAAWLEMKKPRSEDARLSFELEGPDWWILVGLVEKGVSTPLKGPERTQRRELPLLNQLDQSDPI